MADKLRWGILGTGMIAHKFAADLPHSLHGTLAASASRSQQAADAFAQIHGGDALPSYQQLIDRPDVDAIYISLPNGLHAQWSIAALQAGKHVLCEKPIARSEAEAATMFDAARAAGRLLVEAFMYRCHPAVQHAIGLVRSGAIGQLRTIRSNFTFHRPPSPSDARYQPTHGGGGLMDVGCYPLNLARALTASEPTPLACSAHIHPSGVDDYAAALLEFPGQILMTMTCGMTVHSDRGTYLGGDQGGLSIPDAWLCADHRLVLLRPDDSQEDIIIPSSRPRYALEADAFADAALGRVPPWITEQDSLGNMRALDALRTIAGVPLGTPN
jgi:D-xylose 1-dehydrogenase (NADP+, D-xylono-1,5-lactone-forming)